jgi:hypothetical protein
MRCDLAIATHDKKMHKKIYFGCQLKVFGCNFWTMGNHNSSVINQNDLFMHFLAMSRNGQVTLLIKDIWLIKVRGPIIVGNSSCTKTFSYWIILEIA